MIYLIKKKKVPSRVRAYKVDLRRTRMPLTLIRFVKQFSLYSIVVVNVIIRGAVTLSNL